METPELLTRSKTYLLEQINRLPIISDMDNNCINVVEKCGNCKEQLIDSVTANKYLSFKLFFP